MNRPNQSNRMLLAALAASSIFFASNVCAQAKTAAAPIQVASAARPAAPSRLNSNSASWHAAQGNFFKRNWGVDIVDVRTVSSGEMLAFRYIVLDPEKAKVLNDKRSEASLIDEKTGAKLLVPQMEKVGALRTTATPTAGRMYWLIFANTGRIVHAGSQVDVSIGDFNASGLTVVSK